MLQTGKRLIALTLALSVTPLALVSQAPAASASSQPPAAFPAIENLDGRGSKNIDARTHVDVFLKGEAVPVLCQAEGGVAYDSRIWDLVSTDPVMWVPDRYVRTGTNSWANGVPRCVDDRPPSSAPAAVGQVRPDSGSSATTAPAPAQESSDASPDKTTSSQPSAFTPGATTAPVPTSPPTAPTTASPTPAAPPASTSETPTGTDTPVWHPPLLLPSIATSSAPTSANLVSTPDGPRDEGCTVVPSPAADRKQRPHRDITAQTLADQFLLGNGGGFFFTNGDTITEQLRQHDDWLQDLTDQVRNNALTGKGHAYKSMTDMDNLLDAAARDPLNLGAYALWQQPENLVLTYLGTYSVGYNVEPLVGSPCVRVTYDIYNQTTVESLTRVPLIGYTPKVGEWTNLIGAPGLLAAKGNLIPMQDQHIHLTQDVMPRFTLSCELRGSNCPPSNKEDDVA